MKCGLLSSTLIFVLLVQINNSFGKEKSELWNELAQSEISLP